MKTFQVSLHHIWIMNTLQQINGTPITTTHGSVVTNVTDPLGNTFYLSSTYKTILGLLVIIVIR